MQESTKGFLLALFSYCVWGSFALFFYLLRDIPATETLSHRIVWSAVFVIALISITGRWQAVRDALCDTAIVRNLFASSLLIAVNWVLYVWAVANERVIESSLGYFINPLVAVLLGMLVLKEDLSRTQLVAVILAAVGVVHELIGVGQLPWIALVLAVTFALYGLVRKKTPVDTVTGLLVETCLLLPFALAWVLWLTWQGQSNFAADQNGLLLVAAGIVTALPLLAFSAAAQRLSLKVLGFMTYLAPSLQLLSAIFILKEPFSHSQLITFSFIWAGLFVFSFGTLKQLKKAKAAA